MSAVFTLLNYILYQQTWDLKTHRITRYSNSYYMLLFHACLYELATWNGFKIVFEFISLQSMLSVHRHLSEVRKTLHSMYDENCAGEVCFQSDWTLNSMYDYRIRCSITKFTRSIIALDGWTLNVEYNYCIQSLNV